MKSNDPDIVQSLRATTWPLWPGSKKHVKHEQMFCFSQTARWDSNSHWLNDFMSICGHAGCNSSCEQPAETNARWCVSVKPSSRSLQLLSVSNFENSHSSAVWPHSLSENIHPKHQQTQLRLGCFSESGLDGEMLSAPIHTCPHSVKGFHRKWPSTHNHKLPDSSLLYQKFNICCELSVADVFYSWSVLIGSKSTRLFLCAEGSGSRVSSRLHHRVYSVYSSSWLSPCVLHLRVRAGVVRRRWFVTATAMHWERVLVSCFYRSPAAGVTKRAHLNTSVTLYLSSPDYRHNATVSDCGS